jgi:hypothetical protein
VALFRLVAIFRNPPSLYQLFILGVRYFGARLVGFDGNDQQLFEPQPGVPGADFADISGTMSMGWVLLTIQWIE